MPRFRKKPVEVEAVRVQVFPLTKTEGETFFIDNGAKLTYRKKRGEMLEPGWYVDTLEGPLKVSPGDWIIKGVKGEFYPCKPDIFKETYEPVEE